ncbi:tetratricopeptide repeat protein [Hydrogenothermus marinus]|uniref:Tetratricopeptide repeat protein n=1 Tax=Hydrogenothermus marinus TaxID=133270 RepID=A0A3M0BN16_9AQUI|nr:hypothetical protein [Hydrogenothermus marinus]RMA97659.1 hypothetical protein CLV39_0279 [Hydrogenothermus marinus]
MQKEYIYFSIFFEIVGMANFLIFDNIFSIYVYIIFHLIASFFISLVLTPIFAIKLKKQKVKIIILLTTFIFITSVIGIILSIIYVLFYKTSKKKNLNIDILETEDLEEHIPIIKRRLGEGSLQNFNKNLPEHIKLNILSLQKRLKYPNKGVILKEAFSDNNDEIRLLAFSIFSKEEDNINKNIFELQKKLENVNSKEEKADIYKNIAVLYWESIFLGIVDEELKNYYLDLSKEYFLKALSLKQDPEIKFYLGRIALLEKDYKLAEEYLSKAYELGNRKVIPYLMEIYYEKKDFKKIFNLVKNIDLYSIHPNFYFNYKVWSEDEI